MKKKDVITNNITSKTLKFAIKRYLKVMLKIYSSLEYSFVNFS